MGVGGGWGRWRDSNRSFTAHKTSDCNEPAGSTTKNNNRFSHSWDSRCIAVLPRSHLAAATARGQGSCESTCL